MYITRNIYVAAYYRTKGIKSIGTEQQEGLTYWKYEETPELNQRRGEYFRLDPVFLEVVRAKRQILNAMSGNDNND